MADINTRREARRRRILENSESRLRKIAGRNNPDKIEDNLQVKSDSFKVKSNLEECNIRNDTCNINSKAELQDHARNNDDDHARTNDDDYARINDDDHASLNDDDHAKINDDHVKINSDNHARINDDEHENILNVTNDKHACLSEPVSNTELMLCKLLFNRTNFILLAGIVNILLLLKLDHLFGQAVIIPFLLLMLGRLYRWQKFHKVRNGNLLFAALMLCNIKPQFIYRINILFALFSLILHDFGLYMFCFILMRYVISYYHYDVAVNA